jgi:hypothetical protein
MYHCPLCCTNLTYMYHTQYNVKHNYYIYIVIVILHIIVVFDVIYDTYTYAHNLNLTKSIQQCPWKSNRSSTNEETSCILWNLKFHYCVHRSWSNVPVQSQINPFHYLLPHFFKTYIYIILHSKRRSCKQSLFFFRFSNKILH